jgi:carboxymethylenebutenolidase
MQSGAQLDLIDETLDLGFESRPRSGADAGVVLIHDVWGLTDHTRDLTRRLAGEGFAVLALDLYRREAEVRIPDPAAWMQEMSDPQVLGDIAAGVAQLRKGGASGPRRVGVVGFCMGGMYALLAGCDAGCGAEAVVPFYGILSHGHGLFAREGGLDPALKPREPLEAAASLSCPLLAFFGGQDTYIPPEDVRQLEARLSDTGQPVNVVTYPDVGHAFMNDTRPDAYAPDEAREAWKRMVGFLREHLS